MIAENNEEIAENNTSVFNHDYLPQLSAAGSGKYNLQNSQSDYQDGTLTNIDGAKTINYNASVSLNYTLFDGMYRSFNYSKSKELLNLSKLQVQQVIESSILQLIQAYYNMANLTELSNNYKASLKISQSRFSRVTYGVNYGKYTQLDLLNAQVDVNTDSINYLNSLQDVENAKHDLNLILGRDISIGFSIDTVVNYLAMPAVDEAKRLLTEKNTQLLAAEKNIDLSEFDIKLLKTNWIPTVNLRGNYAYTANDYDTKNTLDFYRINGPSAELSLSWSIFDGGRTKIGLQNAHIASKNKQISLEQTKRSVERDLMNAYTSYENTHFVLEAEKANLATSQRNFDRSLEQYKMGQLTSIEFRQAQLFLLQSETRLNNTKYRLKMYELNLYKLMGSLLELKF
jgi:outer membrane protein TolC